MLLPLQLKQMKVMTSSTGPLAPVIRILESNGNVPANPGNLGQVQTALDAILPDDAAACKDAIEILVKAHPSLCYTGVRKFQTKERSPLAGRSFNHGYAKYSSAGFHVQAEIYCIAAQNTDWELGFIQYCTSKSDLSTYHDGSRMEGRSSSAMPVGDSSGPQSEPFYHKGISYGMTNPAWMQLSAQPTGDCNLEMSDEFNNNGHPVRAFGIGGVYTGGVIQSIRRNQSFTCWIARCRPNGDEALLREVSYTITVDSDYVLNGQSLGLGNFATRCRVGRQSTPALPRPVVANYTLNGTEKWWYTAPGQGSVAVNTGINY
jgi:hypothetical protein